MPERCLLLTLGGDPHVQGLHRVSRLAARVGIDTEILPPGSTDDAIFAHIQSRDVHYIGLSYRLSPERGLQELRRLLRALAATGLLSRTGGDARVIAFAALPATIRAVERCRSELPATLVLVPQQLDPAGSARMVLHQFLGRPARQAEEVVEELRGSWFPRRIDALDELAALVVAGDAYRDEPPLAVPSEAARQSFTRRMKEMGRPLIRTHFGIPDRSIQPTVDGIRLLAEARVVDEISLGSSDLSQRYYGQPEVFDQHANAGGVPYRDKSELAALARATRTGNFPGIKPYAHVSGLVPFVSDCLSAGMLVGAHQAVPLFWFNELDGRGPARLGDSLREHRDTVRVLAERHIPVEMNDPNQWSSRWAHDTVVSSSYGLIAAMMSSQGVADAIAQMQFNKPRETGDLADLAKMRAGLALMREVFGDPDRPVALWRQTRTGIDSLDPDLPLAKRQLARSTLLQMLVDPHVVHVVSYCEALHAARPDDVIDSSRLVRRAIRLFGEHRREFDFVAQDPELRQRETYLVEQSRVLLRSIGRLVDPALKADDAQPLWRHVRSLSSVDALEQAVARRYLAAPGIVHPEYTLGPVYTTGPTPFGAIECFDPTSNAVLTEAQRLQRLSG